MSNLGTIRLLLENQIDVGITNTSTDPTSTILNTYINNSIRRILRELRPRELYSSSTTNADIVINTNTVTIPGTIFIPDLVYYTKDDGNVRQLIQKPLKQMIDIETAVNFFDTGNTGDPLYYDAIGLKLRFNKSFSRSDTGAIKIYGLAPPTVLSNDSDSTELPIDYNLLIAYYSAILFYQKDDDIVNQRKFQDLSQTEKASLKLMLDTNDSDSVQLDPHTFGYFPGFSS